MVPAAGAGSCRPAIDAGSQGSGSTSEAAEARRSLLWVAETGALSSYLLVLHVAGGLLPLGATPIRLAGLGPIRVVTPTCVDAPVDVHGVGPGRVRLARRRVSRPRGRHPWIVVAGPGGPSRFGQREGLRGNRLSVCFAICESPRGWHCWSNGAGEG